MRTSLPLISNNCCSPQKFILLVVLVLSCPTKAILVHRSIRNLTDAFCYTYCTTEPTVSYVFIYFCYVNEDKFPINLQRLLLPTVFSFVGCTFLFVTFESYFGSPVHPEFDPCLLLYLLHNRGNYFIFFVMRTCFLLHRMIFFIAGPNFSCVSTYLSTEDHVMSCVLEI